MASGAGGSGGGADGGETPARRGHLCSFQPCQAGWQWCQNIFTRLTESIKNIVPQWLQHYFSKNEAVSEQEPPGLKNRQDDHLICADEESANTHHGRISPEPTVSNTEDTSRTTTSNCPPVVTRPSLHLSHLNFSMSESFALNSEPLTSSFPKGSSRVSLVKEMKDSASQHGNGALENTSVPHLWSVETERHSFSRHTATSSKNPALFRRLSQSIGKSSIVQTSQQGISRFYAVETRYGGSIAFPREPKVRYSPCQAPVAIQMKPKGLNAQSYGVTSLTARRILSQYLEKKSSPVADAERILHVAVAPLNSVDSHYPPIQRLMTTKPVFVHRVIYFKPSLTPCDELKKANQRIDENLSTGYETAMTPGQKTEQDSMSAANRLCSGAGHESGKMTGEREGYLTTKPLEEEVQVTSSNNNGHFISSISTPIVQASQADIGFTFTGPVAKTAELSDCSSNSEPITSSSGVATSLKFGIPSASSEPSQTAECLGDAQVGDQGGLIRDLSSCFMKLKVTSEDFKSTKATGDIKDGVSSDSKRKEVKKDNENGVATSLKFGIPSASSEPSQTAECLGDAQVGDQGGLIRDLSSCFMKLKVTSEDFKSTKATGDIKDGVSSDSKRKEVKKDNENGVATSLKFGIPSASSEPSQTAECLGDAQVGDQGGLIRDLSSCFMKLKVTSEDFKSTKATGDIKDGVSSDSKRKEVKKDNENGVATSLKFGIPSASSEPSQTAECLGDAQVGDQGGLIRDLSSCFMKLKVTSEDFKSTKATGDIKDGVSSDSKRKEVKKDNKNGVATSLKFGIPSASSEPSQTAECLGDAQVGDQGGLIRDLSSCFMKLKVTSEDFKSTKATGDIKDGVSSDSKRKEVKKDNKNGVATSLKFGIPSASSEPSQTAECLGDAQVGDQGGLIRDLSSCFMKLKVTSEDFKSTKATGDIKDGVSSDSKRKEVKKDNKNGVATSLKFGIPSASSEPSLSV